MLAEMGEHQFTIRDYLRHSNLHVTNKYLQATSKSKSRARRDFACRLVAETKPGARAGAYWRVSTWNWCYRPLND